MEKEGYIVRVRERDGGGEETVEFVVGPRGKAEVGERGVAGAVRKVWGKMGTERAELERRLVRSLGEGVEIKRGKNDNEDNEDGDREGQGAGEGQTQDDGEDGVEEQSEEPGQSGGRRRSSRRQTRTPGRGASGRRGRNALVEDEAAGDENEDEDEGEGEGEAGEEGESEGEEE
ncbi:MAG: hypothetical protein Q9211_004092 [Gyalolechia sp. 1 TL-2023]